MAAKKSENQKIDLLYYQDKLRQAAEKGNPEEIAMGHAQLGFAYFQNGAVKEGEEQVVLAGEAAASVENPHQRAKILGVVILAYKSSGQLMEAYLAAESVMKLGLEFNEPGLQADALGTQANLQLESGEVTQAMELFIRAKTITEKSGDQRRLMNITAAIGQCCLDLTKTDQAIENFTSALLLSQELSDKRAEISFRGNLGAILSWQGKQNEAIVHFENMLANLGEEGNIEIEIQTLRHLIKSHTQLKEFPQVSKYARRAIELAKQEAHPMVLELYSSLIFSLHSEELDDEARQITQEAITEARAKKDNESELNLLLSLGESYQLAEMYSEAMGVYQKALNAAKRQDRKVDAAFLMGRVGVSLAEQGELDRAIKYHHEAVELAKKQKLSDLEGEQLSMLSLAYLDKGELDQAKQYCEASLKVYQTAGIEHGVEKAGILLKQIEAAE